MSYIVILMSFQTIYSSNYGLIYSQGWELIVNKLFAVNANTLKTYKYCGDEEQ